MLQYSVLFCHVSHSGLCLQAQNLASDTSGLCETANMYVQCYASEEKLTAAAKSVAVTMSQLFYVALAKVDAESPHNQKLQVKNYNLL